MQIRKLGSQGLQVSSLGLGCMGMSFAYGNPGDESNLLKTLQHSLDLGINFWDSAEIYGPFTNEVLLGKALRGRRQRVVVATKFAFKFNENGERAGLDSSPAHIKKTIEGSLKRLGTDYIDLYYQHRLDPKTPIEDTVKALSELVKEGKVRYIGLSEVGPNTIRRAHKIHPVSALQSEYSLWERSVEEKTLPVLRELGIGLVPYSPVGRGFLTGQIKSPEDFEADDFRRQSPRFQGSAFKHNLTLVDEVKKIAMLRKATPSQVALAWLLAQGSDIVPIPGTTKVKHLEENARAADLELTRQDLDQITAVLAKFETAGERYTADMMKTISTD